MKITGQSNTEMINYGKIQSVKILTTNLGTKFLREFVITHALLRTFKYADHIHEMFAISVPSRY